MNDTVKEEAQELFSSFLYNPVGKAFCFGRWYCLEFKLCVFSIAAQPAGVPEILKKSLHSCSVKGEEEVFLIGKNFLKGTKVIFQENVSG